MQLPLEPFAELSILNFLLPGISVGLCLYDDASDGV